MQYTGKLVNKFVSNRKMSASRNSRYLLDYKLTKIVRLVRKMKRTIEQEGLGSGQLTKTIEECLKLDQIQELNASRKPFSINQLQADSFVYDSNRFAVSVLVALSSSYQDLLNQLNSDSETEKADNQCVSAEVFVKIE